jgi:hypothetical protein
MRNIADGAIPGTGNTGDESRKWELSWVEEVGGGGGGDAGSACPSYIYFLWDRKQSTDVIIIELFIFSQTV